MAAMAEIIQKFLAEQWAKNHPAPGPLQAPNPATDPGTGQSQSQSASQTDPNAPTQQQNQPSIMGWGGQNQAQGPGGAMGGAAGGGAAGAPAAGGGGASGKMVKEMPWWDQGLTFVGGREHFGAPGGGPNININMSQSQAQQQQQQQQQWINQPAPQQPQQPGPQQPQIPGGHDTPTPGGHDTPTPGGHDTPTPGGHDTPTPGGHDTPTPMPGGDPEFPPGSFADRPRIPRTGGPSPGFPGLRNNLIPINSWPNGTPNPTTPGGGMPGGGLINAGVTPTNPSGMGFDPPNLSTTAPGGARPSLHPGSNNNPNWRTLPGRLNDIVGSPDPSRLPVSISQGHRGSFLGIPYGNAPEDRTLVPQTDNLWPRYVQGESPDQQKVSLATGGGLMKEDSSPGDGKFGGLVPAGNGAFTNPQTGQVLTYDSATGNYDDASTGQHFRWDSGKGTYADMNGMPISGSGGPAPEPDFSQNPARLDFSQLDGQPPPGDGGRPAAPSGAPARPRVPGSIVYGEGGHPIDPVSRRPIEPRAPADPSAPVEYYDKESGEKLRWDEGSKRWVSDNTGAPIAESPLFATSNLEKDPGSGHILRKDPQTGSIIDQDSGRPVVFDPLYGRYVDAETHQPLGHQSGAAASSSALTAKWTPQKWAQPPGNPSAKIAQNATLAPFQRQRAPGAANMLPQQSPPTPAQLSPQKPQLWPQGGGGRGGSQLGGASRFGQPTLTAGTTFGGGSGGGAGGGSSLGPSASATPRSMTQSTRPNVVTMLPTFGQPTSSSSSTSSFTPAPSMPAAFSPLAGLGGSAAPTASTLPPPVSSPTTSTAVPTRPPLPTSTSTPRPPSPTYPLPNYGALASYLPSYRPPTSPAWPTTSVGSAWSYTAPAYRPPTGIVTRPPTFSTPSFSAPRPVSSSTFSSIAAPRPVASTAVFRAPTFSPSSFIPF